MALAAPASGGGGGGAWGGLELKALRAAPPQLSSALCIACVCRAAHPWQPATNSAHRAAAACAAAARAAARFALSATAACLVRVRVRLRLSRP